MKRKTSYYKLELTIKKALTVCLCVAIITGIFPADAMAIEEAPIVTEWAGGIASNYSKGTGTESDPFQISNAEELAYFAKSVNLGNSYKNTFFIIVQEINLSEAEWVPIGNEKTIFEGTLDGRDQNICNLFISSSDNDIGLFSELGLTAIVKNLTISSASVSGSQNVGAISGSSKGEISNCKIKTSKVLGESGIGGISGRTCNNIYDCTINDSQIRGETECVGGVVGCGDFHGPYSYDIKKCRVKNSKVVGENYVGGIVGYKGQGSSAGYYGMNIIQSFNASEIIGTKCVGGILGGSYHFNTGDSVSVKECHNSGNISGTKYIGGIVGRTTGAFNNGSTRIENSYNTGKVDASETFGAGICGGTSKKIKNCHNVGDITSNGVAAAICADPLVYMLDEAYYAIIENCYYMQGADDNAEQLSFRDFKNKTSFKTWDFDNVWTFGNNDFPELRALQINDVEEPEQPKKDFNYYTYRADWLLRDCEDTRFINYKLGLETITRTLVNVLQEEERFGNSLKAWESFELFFSQLDKGPIGALYDQECEKKDVYQAIILDALHVSLQEDVLDRCKEGYKDAVNNSQVVLKNWKSTVGDLNDKGVFKKLSFKQKKDLGNDLIENIELTNDVINGSKLGLDFIDAGIKLADCFDSLCEQIYSGIMMIEMTDALKNVVRQLYLNCPYEQYHLKNAIKSCTEVMDLSVEQFLNKVRNDKIAGLGKDAIVILSEQLWGCVKKVLQTSFPWVDLLVSAYNTGKMLSNQLFNTEDIVEQYFHMTALLEYETVMDRTLSQFKNNYSNENNAVNAENYLNAVDLTFAFKNLDCKDACEFVDKIGKGLVNKLFYDKKEYASIKEYYQKVQTNNDIAYTYYRIKWIDELKLDYPDLYLEYSDVRVQFLKSIKIACPVNVFVYDKDGELVAYVEDGKAWSSNKVTLQVEGDVKKIYFYDEEEYRIDYIGNDSGVMDVSIAEYDKNRKEVREACFYDLPLHEGKEYMGTIDGRVLQKKEYVIVDGKTSIQSDIDTLLDEDTDIKNTAKVVNGYFVSDSSISREKKYLANQSVSIRAILPKGMKFVKWTSDAGNIFEDETDVNTTFMMPNKDVEIKAQFMTGSDSAGTGGGVPTVSKKTITSENGVGGTISPSKKVELSNGSSQTFTITPDSGYEIADVLIDGKSVGDVSAYTFENVTSNHTISATFKKKEKENNKDFEAENLAKKIKAAKDVKVKASSSQGVNKNGKRYIKVKWTKKGAAVTGYQVYRSFKKKSSYKKFYTTKRKYYYNTKALKKGKRHYYKVRAYTVIGGKKYYSKWSNLAYRTVKK